MYVYVVELFPTTARALGGGVTAAFGTVGSSISPLLLVFLERKSIDRNILFAVVAFLAVGISNFMPETLGIPLKEEIDEIALEKKELKKYQKH